LWPFGSFKSKITNRIVYNSQKNICLHFLDNILAIIRGQNFSRSFSADWKIRKCDTWYHWWMNESPSGGNDLTIDLDSELTGTRVGGGGGTSGDGEKGLGRLLVVFFVSRSTSGNSFPVMPSATSFSVMPCSTSG
jgi:hypothetical protein